MIKHISINRIGILVNIIIAAMWAINGYYLVSAIFIGVALSWVMEE